MEPNLLRCTIPKKPPIASWNTTKPELWSLSQCLEFFELSDVSQRKVFSAVHLLTEKQGAAKARYWIMGRLTLLIQYFQSEAQAAGLPELPSDTPYPDLYLPIGQMSVTTLMEKLNQAQTWYQKHVADNEDHAELKHAETLKYVILYSLERRLSFLFNHHETQLEHLPHLRRFVKANPHLFSILEKPKLRPFASDTLHLEAFFANIHISPQTSSDGDGENEECDAEEGDQRGPVAKTVYIRDDVKQVEIRFPDSLFKKKATLPANTSCNQ